MSKVAAAPSGRLEFSDLLDPGAVAGALLRGIVTTGVGHLVLAVIILVPCLAVVWDRKAALAERRASAGREAQVDGRDPADTGWFWDGLAQRPVADGPEGLRRHQTATLSQPILPSSQQRWVPWRTTQRPAA